MPSTARKIVPLRSFVLSLDDVKKIHARLSKQVIEEGERRVNTWVQEPGQTDQQFDVAKENARRLHRVDIVITGTDFSTLSGDVRQLDSPNRPDPVGAISMTNTTAFLEQFGRSPINAFQLNLDFSKPTLLDLHNPVSSPTPNNSHITVEGDRDSWISSISDAVTGIVDGRKTRRTWLHKANRYDLGMWVIVLPLSLYTCWRLSSVIDRIFATIHPVLVVAAYFYVGFGVIWIYRFVFGYTKWAFPTAELSDNRDSASAHRRNWWVLILGILASVIAAFFV